MSDDASPHVPSSASGSALPWIALGILLLGFGGAAAFLLMKPEPAAVPSDVASDPLLAMGHDLYLERCAICHGRTGVGDGPMAKGISNPPVGNLTDGEWRHGDKPGEVLAVVRDGVPNTQMQGFGKALNDRQLKAVTAYVLHLVGREVPPELRKK